MKKTELDLLDEYIYSDRLNDVTELRCKFLGYITAKLCKHRIYDYKKGLFWFREFLRIKNIKDLNRITLSHLLQYQQYLYDVRPYKEVTVRKFTWAVRRYLMWLYHERLIQALPWQGLYYIKPPNDDCLRKPGRYYTADELFKLWHSRLKSHQYTPNTIKRKLKDVEIFFTYLKENDILSVYKITSDNISGFCEYLKTLQYEQGCYYGIFRRGVIVHSVGQFIKWLCFRRILKKDPTEGFNTKIYPNINWNKTGPRKFRRKHIKIPDPLLYEFRKYFIARGFKADTANAYLRNLTEFYNYLSKRGINSIKDVTKRHIMEYHLYLIQLDKYVNNTISNRLIQIRSYFRFLVKYEILTADPSSAVDLPKEEDGLPHTCMTEREVNLLLSLPDTYDTVGIRDKAAMETFYSTGVRSSELCGIRLSDIDYTQRLLTIYFPKGGKSYQRVIPIGKVAVYWMKRYVAEVRPFLVKEKNDWLFLSTHGNRMFKHNITALVKKYVHKSGLRKQISSHSFRVSCATHMLKHNADIRYVQAQLGHRCIETTKQYTRLVPTDLKRIHGLCHPREIKTRKNHLKMI